MSMRTRDPDHEKNSGVSRPVTSSCVAGETMRAVCLANPKRIARWPAVCTHCTLAIRTPRHRPTIGHEA
jgi:hypothetical protein